MNKVLSIIVPSYNTEKYMNDCVGTMLDDRTLEDVEILIVNDGSKDNTAVLANALVEKYPRTIRHINKENGGHGSTINRGIEEASGKYLRVIDGDDWVDTENFVEYVEALKNSDEDIIMTPFQHYYEADKGKDNVDIDYPVGSYKFAEITDSVFKSYQIHSTTFKTETIRNIRKIREHCFYVDQEYIFYPLSFAKSVKVLPYHVYQYRIGTQEQSVSMTNMVKNRKMHMNVIFDLIDFLSEEAIDPIIRGFIVKRVGMLARRQIEIFLAMEDKSEGRKACKAYLNDLKSKSREVYNAMPGLRPRLFRINSNLAYAVFYGR